MKNRIILLFLFLSLNNLFAEQTNFDYEYMFCDFNGIVTDNEKVIAYGTNSVLLISYDKGKTWQQTKIDIIEANIKKIIYFNNNFYGICRNGILIKSSSDKLNFNSSIIDEQIIFTDFIIEDEKLFILTQEKTVLIYNLDMVYLEKIPLDTTYSYRGLIAHNSNLLLPTNYPHILSIKISDFNKQNIIDLSEYGDFVRDLKVYNNNLYANIGGSVYKTQDPQAVWEKISYSIKSYQIHNDELYDLAISQHILWKVAWIDFYKINSQLQKEKTNTDSIDRFINPNLTINDFIFIDDNTIIAVGTSKTIYLSENKGQNWNLKSNIINHSSYYPFKQWLNDKIGYFTNAGHVFRTQDGGITWLPQKFTDTLISKIKYLSAFKMFEDGVGIAFSFDNIINNADTTKNITLIYTRDYGDTFQSEFHRELAGGWFQKYPVQIKKIDSLYVINFCPTNNELTAVYYYDKDFKLLNKTFVYDILISTFKETKDDSIIAIAQDIHPPFKEDYRDSSKILLMHLPHTGNTVWEIDYEFIVEGWAPYVIIWVEDKVFLRTQKQYPNSGYGTIFYHLNLETKQINKIYADTTYNNSYVMLYQGNIYIRNKDSILISTSDYKKPIDEINWKTENDFPSLPFYTSNNYWSNDTSFYATKSELRSMRYYFDLLKFYPQTTTSVNEEIEKLNYFFSTPPEPSPAKDKVRVTVFWDQGVDISLANIKIYNFLGNEIINNKDITTIPIKSYSEEIIWNCSGVSSGLYFINLSYGSFTHSVPILVFK